MFVQRRTRTIGWPGDGVRVPSLESSAPKRLQVVCPKVAGSQGVEVPTADSCAAQQPDDQRTAVGLFKAGKVSGKVSGQGVQVLHMRACSHATLLNFSLA